MKKGLLTVLLASLVLVGCQNYDDQFDDLNAQISALKSQVDGLSSLSGQVSSLAGTISGLQAGVSAAQAAATAAGASADAATAAGIAATAAATASTADLSGLETSLATLADEVAAVQASLKTAATATAVQDLQDEIDAIELSLQDLLDSSNIYSTDVTVTNATTLNAALALGNKLNVFNATLTINGYSGMDYAEVQQLVDRVNTMTGNLVYSAASAAGTEIVFNNLVSAGNITVTQPGGYSFPKLTTAGEIDLRDDYETTVTNISFPALTSAASIETDTSAGDFEVIFTYATNVDFGALVTAPSNTITITTKKDATLDLDAWLSQDALENKTDATVTLNGPASFTNGTAAGTFASTGLGGNTLGAHDGTIELTNVATAAIHNFRGTITLNAGVKNFTGNNVVTVGGAMTDMETINLTMIRDNDPGLSTAAVADLAESDMNDAQNLSFGSSHTKLTSITLTGKGGDVTVDDADAVTTVDLTGLDAFDIDITNNDALVAYTDSSKAEDFEFDNNDVMTSLDASHTTKLTAASDLGVKASITGNAELTSLTIGFDDVNDLDITTNAKLATISAASLKDNGSDTVATVDIYDNAFVASLVKDSMESDATRDATGWAVGGSTDTGTITSDSGLSTLDAYLADALATTSTISVWFDSVTKLETQSTYGGAFTDNTSKLPTAAFTRNDAAAVAFTGSSRTGYLVYLYNVDEVTAVTVDDGVISKERKSYAFDLSRDASSQAEASMAVGEGITVERGAGKGSVTFVQGAAYTGAANGATVANLTDLINYINADTGLAAAANIDIAAEQDGYKKALYTVSFTNSTGATAVAGATSGTGNLYFKFGTKDSDGSANYTTAAVASDNSGADDLAHAIRTAIDGLTEWNATATGGNANQFYVTKATSGRTDAINTSPMVTFPTIDYQLTSATTTVRLVDSGYDGAYTNNWVTVVNANGVASSLFSLTDDSASVKNGLRITLTNNTGIAFNASVGLTVNYDAVTNTLLVTADNTTATGITQGLMSAGVNIATFRSRYNETPADYVAAFSAISAGTSRTTTDGVTGVLTNRTGW
jgi:hypothetical protein